MNNIDLKDNTIDSSIPSANVTVATVAPIQTFFRETKTCILLTWTLS